MNCLKTITLGTIYGTLTGLVGVLLAGSLWVLLTGQPAVLVTLVVFGLISGAVVGGSSCLLAQMTQGSEHRVLVILVSTAVAATFVLLGNYNSQSIVPFALYALALVNGLLVAQITAVQLRNA